MVLDAIQRRLHAQFMKDRHETFMDMTPERVAAFSKRWEIWQPSTKEATLYGSHIARSHMTDIPMELRQESIKWMREQGHTKEADLAESALGEIEDADTPFQIPGHREPSRD